MTTEVTNRYWLIRHPASGDPKKTVAQFDTDGGALIPDEVAEYDDFHIQEVSDNSSLVDTVDQSRLSEDEKDLLSQIYPIIE